MISHLSIKNNINMPLKIGKSKSSTGTDFNNVHNVVVEDTPQMQKKTKGLRRLLDRAKLSTKIPSPKPVTTVSRDDNQIKYKNKMSAIESPGGQVRKNSSPGRPTCSSVSPKLYTNSCASSTEELSSCTGNTTNTGSAQATNTCSPIQDVILEEDYEEALQHVKPCLNGRGSIATPDTAGPGSGTPSPCLSSTVVPQLTSSGKPNQSIYNEPTDTHKDVSETCRLTQMTPTNQLKEMRSRAGSDTADSLTTVMLHPELMIGTRERASLRTPCLITDPASVRPGCVSECARSCGSAASSSQESAHTLSEGAPLSVDVPPQSGPASVSPSTPASGSYANSPKGNTVICHHPASPFAPPPAATTATTTPDSSVPQPSSTPSVSQRVPFVSRRGKAFQHAVCLSDTVHTAPCPGVASAAAASAVAAGGGPVAVHRAPNRRSECYSRQPLYEEAWDVKMQKLCRDMIHTSRTPAPSVGSVVASASAASNNVDRPQSSAAYSSPAPAVPPHRRGSTTSHLRPSAEDESESGPAAACRRGNICHCVNPTFAPDSAAAATNAGETSVTTSEYDYAYNETWSMGVQRNMSLNLEASGGGGIGGPPNRETPPPASSAAVAAASDSVSALTTKTQEMESLVPAAAACANVDNDSSLSNDSYEEPWDVRHGRVISELTSARLIDPACVPSSSRLRSGSGRAATVSAVTGSTTATSSTTATNQQMLGTGQPTALINTSIALEDQPWYHDECSRVRAEQLLVNAKEGSFLVRKSETCRNNYSLTIKHRNEYLHMKISLNQQRGAGCGAGSGGGFILGQYSQPYVSVPHMLHHYSLTMVPVRGADCVQLCHPVICITSRGDSAL